MTLLLAILLYLQLIFSPGVYQESYIHQLEAQHQPEIQAVQNDPRQMDIVHRDYVPQTENIVVVADGEGD